VGALVGVPLGIVAGRLAWRAVARSIGVVERPKTPVIALVAIATLAVVVANVVAALPVRMAKRIPATILRTG